MKRFDQHASWRNELDLASAKLMRSLLDTGRSRRWQQNSMAVRGFGSGIAHVLRQARASPVPRLARLEPRFFPATQHKEVGMTNTFVVTTAQATAWRDNNLAQEGL
jgi:hypothetical protein